jgi:hypothetical protein
MSGDNFELIVLYELLIELEEADLEYNNVFNISMSLCLTH